MKINIKTNNEVHHKLLKVYSKPLSKIMHHLKKQYRFRLPASIILRPLRPHTRKGCASLTFGRAGYTPNLGYWIAMNMNLYNDMNSLALSTLAHEAAHLAEAMKTKRWTHGKLWKEMYEVAEGIVVNREAIM